MSPTFRIWSSWSSNLVQSRDYDTSAMGQPVQNIPNPSTNVSRVPLPTTQLSTLTKELSSTVDVRRRVGNGTESLCDLHPRYCLNNGICFVTSNGKMQCWCPSTFKLWYRGDHCETTESIAKVSAITGGCAVVFLIVVILLVVRIAKLTMRIDNMERRSTYEGRRFRGLRLPFVTGGVNKDLPGVQMIVSPASLGLGRSSLSSIEPRSNVTPSVRYSQLSTITKDGEARTRFTSNDTCNTETLSSFNVAEDNERNRLNARGLYSSCQMTRCKYETTGIIL